MGGSKATDNLSAFYPIYTPSLKKQEDVTRLCFKDNTFFI